MTRKEETGADFQSCHLRGSRNLHTRNGGQGCVLEGLGSAWPGFHT